MIGTSGFHLNATLGVDHRLTPHLAAAVDFHRSALLGYWASQSAARLPPASPLASPTMPQWTRQAHHPAQLTAPVTRLTTQHLPGRFMLLSGDTPN